MGRGYADAATGFRRRTALTAEGKASGSTWVAYPLVTALWPLAVRCLGGASVRRWAVRFPVSGVRLVASSDTVAGIPPGTAAAVAPRLPESRTGAARGRYRARARTKPTTTRPSEGSSVTGTSEGGRRRPQRPAQAGDSHSVARVISSATRP